MADIEIHGRAGLEMPFSRFKLINNVETQVDLTNAVLTFECVAAGLSVALVADANDALGKLIKLSRSQVADISTKGYEFAIVDSTGTTPFVDWSGTIIRVGFK